MLCFRIWSNFKLFLGREYHPFLGTGPPPPPYTHCLFSSSGRFPHEITLLMLIRTFHSPCLFQVQKLHYLWPLGQLIFFEEILWLQQVMFQFGGYSHSGCFLLEHTIPKWAGAGIKWSRLWKRESHSCVTPQQHKGSCVQHAQLREMRWTLTEVNLRLRSISTWVHGGTEWLPAAKELRNGTSSSLPLQQEPSGTFGHLRWKVVIKINLQGWLVSSVRVQCS